MRPLTRSCFLLFVLGRLFLLAFPFLLGICLCLRWSPLFPLQALALISLSLAKVRFSTTLTLCPLMIWCFGQTALFLFLLAKSALAFLPTVFSVALRLLLPFWHAQYVQVFPLKPAPFCTISAGHGSTNKSAISLLFSSYLTLVLSSPPSFLLPKTLWQIGQVLPSLSCSIRLQWIPGHSCLRENDAADELARRGALLAHSAIPCSLSRLISRIHSRLILDWRHTVLSKFFNTQVPSISTEELVLPRHARGVLISRLRCNGHSLLLGPYLSRIGRIENPSCSACGHSSQDTSHLILHCPATDSLRRSLFGDSLSLYNPGPDRGELPGFWGSMVFRHVPIFRKGSGKQQQHVKFVALYGKLINCTFEKPNSKKGPQAKISQICRKCCRTSKLIRE